MPGGGPAGLCGTGSFDWALSDVFLPDRRTMPRRHPSRGPTGAPARRQLCIAVQTPWTLTQCGNYRHSARQAMDLMYRHGGSRSFRRESRLAECWCHLHTVAQTVSLSPEWYPIGERAYLSIDPGRRQG